MAKRSIYGVHEGPLDWLSDVAGWVVLTVHAWQVDRVNARAITDAGHVPIVRLNNGYWPEGTLPHMGKYEAFADRLGLIAGNSPDVHHWIVGNEPNQEQEWPGGVSIYPEQYARCYRLCRQAIEARPGHEGDQVLVAAIAPWTAKVSYFGNERGDWVQYLADVIAAIGEPDGYALHTYTHQHDPGQVTSAAKMDPPFADRHYQFYAFADFMGVVPRGAPVYITECCPVDSGWDNANNGWVQAAYREIDKWNRTSDTPIRCLALYRGVAVDRWYFADKAQVRLDWEQAKAAGYTVDIDDGGDEEEPVTIIQDSFDSSFAPYQGIGELTVPLGWVPVWVQGTEPGILVRIEVQKAGAAQTRSGSGAVAIHSRNSTIDGALYRQFPVVLGSDVVASVWCLKTEAAMGHGMQIGIDPMGGTDHTASRVVWSDWYSEHSPDYAVNAWRQRIIKATAQAGQITVFLRSKIDYKADGSHAHFDDLAVELIEPSTPPAPPPAGSTHRLRVYLDDELVVDSQFEAQAVGVTFRAAGVASQSVAKGLLGWLRSLWRG